MKKSITKDIIAILFIVIVSYPSVKPLLGSGFFPMHDDTQVGRVAVMGRALENGQFPVRWVSDLGYGYGYPIFNFYAPLPYYVGGIFYVLGANALLSTKLMIYLGFILSGIAMYTAIRSIINRDAAIVSALLYIFAPYHAVQLYVRGAIGEIWFGVFLPLVFLSFWMVFHSTRRRAILLGGLSLAGMIISHTIMGYIATGVTVLVGAGYGLRQLILKQHQQRTVMFVSVVLLGLALSAFYWMPALSEMQYTRVAGQLWDQVNFRDHYVCLSQLWSSPWGFGGSAPGCADGMSFMLGKLHMVLFLMSFIAWVWLKRPKSDQSKFMLVITATAFGSLLMLLPISLPIWNITPFAAYVQYPWRFLAFAMFAVSAAVGYILALLGSRISRVTAVLVITGLIIVYNSKWFNPQYIYDKPVADFVSEAELRYRVSRVSDEYLPPQIVRPENIGSVVHDTIPYTKGVQIGYDVDTQTYGKFTLISDGEYDIQVNRAYFPGWHYSVNGKSVIPDIRNGIGHVHISNGLSTIEIRFTDTPIRKAGNFITLLGLGLLFYVYGKKTTR